MTNIMGEEPWTFTKCPDCGVLPGSPHTDHCDVARCLYDGGQRLMHELPDDTLYVVIGEVPVREEHDCGRDVWTGEWPGSAECREYGFWTRWDNTPHVRDGFTYPGQWRECDADDPDAQPDLTRLYQCTWDRDQGRWIK